MPVVPLGPVRSEQPEGVIPIPIVVTTEFPSEVRRWQVLLASKGLTVLRGGGPSRDFDAPLINAHVEHHDVWLSWIQPEKDPAGLRESLRRQWEENEQWLDSHGRRAQDVERHEAWGRIRSGLADLGYSVVKRPGSIRWLQFTSRDQHIDWRLKADVIAEMVWRESSGDGM